MCFLDEQKVLFRQALDFSAVLQVLVAECLKGLAAVVAAVARLVLFFNSVNQGIFAAIAHYQINTRQSSYCRGVQPA